LEFKAKIIHCLASSVTEPRGRTASNFYFSDNKTFSTFYGRNEGSMVSSLSRD
jgi:hypothetical protein